MPAFFEINQYQQLLFEKEEMEKLEKELENKIADVIREFKNTYSVLPFLKIENSENVKVSLEMNRYTINPRTLYNQILEHQKDHQ